jgi:hypothetical protein
MKVTPIFHIRVFRSYPMKVIPIFHNAYFVLDPIIELVEMQSHDVLSVQLTPTDIGIINRIVLLYDYGLYKQVYRMIC